MPGTSELKQADALRGTASGVLCIRADELFAADRRRLAAKLRVACLETGFFEVALGPADNAAVAAMLSQMQHFFALDDADKFDVRQRDGDHGWVPRFTEPAYQPGTVSNLEAFEFGRDALAPGARCWPALPGLREHAGTCWSTFAGLGDAVLRVIALALGVDEDCLSSRCDSHALSKMRLLYYDGDTAPADGRAVGIAAHTDFECITLLYQSAPGLELLGVDGRWLDAPAAPGRIVVLLDDMLERWTNGVFAATGHRVRRSAHERYSIVMFMAANDGIEIAPLPEFVSADRPSRYAPVTQARHIAAELERAAAN